MLKVMLLNSADPLNSTLTASTEIMISKNKAANINVLGKKLNVNSFGAGQVVRGSRSVFLHNQHILLVFHIFNLARKSIFEKRYDPIVANEAGRIVYKKTAERHFIGRGENTFER
jgi:hypothetical protein